MSKSLTIVRFGNTGVVAIGYREPDGRERPMTLKECEECINVIMQAESPKAPGPGLLLYGFSFLNRRGRLEGYVGSGESQYIEQIRLSYMHELEFSCGTLTPILLPLPEIMPEINGENHVQKRANPAFPIDSDSSTGPPPNEAE